MHKLTEIDLEGCTAVCEEDGFIAIYVDPQRRCRCRAQVRASENARSRLGYQRVKRQRRLEKLAGRPCPERCECCGDLPDEGHGDRLHFDHDHSCCPVTDTRYTCGKCFRGWICQRCNLTIGQAATIERLEQVIEYLRKSV